MKPLRSILAAGFALVACAVSIHAEVLPIFEDTFGTKPAATIKKASGAAKTITITAKNTAYIGFAAGSTGIDPAAVTNARLTIFLSKVTKPGNITFHNVTGNFTETFTAASIPEPAVAAPFETITIAAGDAREFLIVDVTDEVKAWLTTPAAERGIAIRGTGLVSCIIATKEGAGSGHPAQIEIDAVVPADGTVTSSKLAANLTLGGNLTVAGGSLFATDGNTLFSSSDMGKLSQAAGISFASGTGLLLENNSIGESGGLFINGNSAAIWSAANNGQIVAFYDEDSFPAAGTAPTPASFIRDDGALVIQSSSSTYGADASVNGTATVTGTLNANGGLNASGLNIDGTNGTLNLNSGFTPGGSGTTLLGLGFIGKNNAGPQVRFSREGVGGFNDIGMSGNGNFVLENGSDVAILTATQTGLFSIGGTAPSSVLGVNTNGVVNNTLAVQGRAGDDVYLNVFRKVANGGNEMFRITDFAGTPQLELLVGNAFKPGGGSWGALSDRRLKKDIEPLDGALGQLLKLRSVTYEYIDPVKSHQFAGTQTGFIAQEVEEVFPEWVTENAEGYKTVTIRGFESLAVQALRELRKEKDAEIAALNARLATLEARDREREARLARLESALDDRPARTVRASVVRK